MTCLAPPDACWWSYTSPIAVDFDPSQHQPESGFFSSYRGFPCECLNWAGMSVMLSVYQDCASAYWVFGILYVMSKVETIITTDYLVVINLPRDCCDNITLYGKLEVDWWPTIDGAYVANGCAVTRRGQIPFPANPNWIQYCGYLGKHSKALLHSLQQGLCSSQSSVFSLDETRHVDSYLPV